MSLVMLSLLATITGCTAVEANSPAMPDAPPPIEAGASATVGAAAPDFALPTLDGSVVRLSDFAGKTVVLEWFNPGCPFVKDVYNSDEMTNLANKWAEQDVAWIAINSGAPGNQGTGIDANTRAVSKWDMKHPVLLDESGAVGRAYGAKTTPHMYVISPSGELAFAGAFSNAPLGQISGDGDKVNYVDAALAAITSGQPVAETAPKAWGCSVKYGS